MKNVRSFFVLYRKKLPQGVAVPARLTSVRPGFRPQVRKKPSTKLKALFFEPAGKSHRFFSGLLLRLHRHRRLISNFCFLNFEKTIGEEFGSILTFFFFDTQRAVNNFLSDLNRIMNLSSLSARGENKFYQWNIFILDKCDSRFRQVIHDLPFYIASRSRLQPE